MTHTHALFNKQRKVQDGLVLLLANLWLAPLRINTVRQCFSTKETFLFCVYVRFCSTVLLGSGK